MADPEFTDSARAALLWVLWHHQGGSSPVGQPIRFALGMDQHERLSDEQIRQAKEWDALMSERQRIAAGEPPSDGQPSCAAIQSTPAPQGRES